MRSFMIPAAFAIGVTAAAPAFAVMPAAQPAPTAAASGVTPVQYYYRHYHRHYRGYRGGGWVPYRYRGFNDPGYAYHGNINGCAVDLGYGRWESCNRGR
jgi:hypothetical protein